MAKIDASYKNLLLKIISSGRWYNDPNRKGVKRLQIPSYNFEYDMSDGSFPAMSTKLLYFKSVVGELIWFLRGDTSPKYLIDNKINIWNKDGVSFLNSKTGDNMSVEKYTQQVRDGYLVSDLGRIYGAQWRNFLGFNQGFDEAIKNFGEEIKGIDQISNLFKNLIEKPYATDHIVTAWNPTELDQMALPPCHFMFQIMVYPLNEKCECSESEAIYCGSKCQQKGFDLIWDQRSVDTFLGLPFNIASYALLMRIIESITGYKAMTLTGSLRNVHLYDNSIKAVNKQFIRDVDRFEECELVIKKPIKNLECLEISDFMLKNYQSFGPLSVEMLNRNV